MTTTHDDRTTQADLRGGTMHVPRSRGALSGIMLIILGAWGALIPFIGPYFNLSYTPDTAWHWSAARGWLEVLPGVVAFVGGVLSLMSRNRAVISLGAWLGVAAGAWFAIGLTVAGWFHIGSPGQPAGTSTAIHSVETLVMFTGLGALILLFGAMAAGRLSVHSIRDVRAARRRVADDTAGETGTRTRTGRDTAYEQGRRDGLTAAQPTGAPAGTTGQHAATADRPTTMAPGQQTGPGYPAAPLPPPPASAGSTGDVTNSDIRTERNAPPR